MPINSDDNTIENSIWDKSGIVFYSTNLRSTNSAQSLASLMTALVKLGHSVYHITIEQPNGDDFITDNRVTRYVLSYLELGGYSTSAAFYKVLGELPVKTVVFFNPFNSKTYECYIAAEKLGRCIIMAQDRSPYLSVTSGNTKLMSEYFYMIQNADCVISTSKQDSGIIESMGVKKSISLPFYFPYYDSEVTASKLAGQKIVYYTTYAGKNTRAAITAFARLHERFPNASMHIVVWSNVMKSRFLDDLMDDIKNANLSDCLTIENKVLKPLRYLRDASVSITYAHLLHMPKTVMESICAGIPAILLQDADYSNDNNPAICINAADIYSIEDKLAELMDKGNRVEYSAKVRKLLNPDYRCELAKSWSDCIKEVVEAYDQKINDCTEKGVFLKVQITDLLQKSTELNEIFKFLIMEKFSCGEIISASLYCGLSIEQILSAYNLAGVLGQRDFKIMLYRLKYWLEFKKMFINGFDKDILVNQYKNKNIFLPDMVCMLAAGGMEIGQISSFLPGIIIDSRQVEWVLQNAINTNKCMFNLDYINYELLEVEYNKDCAPATLNLQNAVKAFCQQNIKYLTFKKHKLINKTIRFQAWYNQPLSLMGFWGKIIAAPFKLRNHLKETIHLKGKKRLIKREITEVDPADTRKIQLLVFQIMLEFDKICKKHNLRYYIAGGSILGAIRHKGFIPWDDDIDITMPRPDYEKLLKIAPKELPEEYILENDCIPYCHNRIEIRGTKFHSGLRNGRIFLDILALDGSPNDMDKRLEHEAKCKYWRTYMLEKARPIPALAFNKVSTKLFFKRLILRAVPRRFLKWRWHSWAAKYSPEETDSWVCLPASIYTYEQERFPKDYWGEPVLIEFEGHMLPTMSHWKDYLVCHFGDYMKMPPETTRKSHHYVFEYNLGKYENISTEELEKTVLGK